ncbi:integral membrane protein, partial [Metarhizium majus ARSEF 297]
MAREPLHQLPREPWYSRGSVVLRAPLIMWSVCRKLVASFALIYCAVWYAQTHFYRDPGSRFFDPSRAYEQKYSRHRRAEVQQFIEQYVYADAAQDAPTPGELGAGRSLCVTFTSVRRQRTQYVETAVASALGNLLPQERADVYVNVFIAETNPDQHPTWHREWVRSAVDSLYTYNVSQAQAEHLKTLEEKREFAEKGVFDYIYALEACANTDTPYIGILEDDVMLADGWLVRALLGLRDIARLHKPWLYMRMFNQERSTGWSSRHVGSHNEHWIVLAIWAGGSGPVLLARRRWKAARAHLDPASLLVLAGVVVPALVVLFFQCGKASVWPPSPGVVDEPFGCCSQVMVFPREQVSSLVRFLGTRRGQVDLLLNEWAEEASLARYALYPVMAQHIGVDSARGTVVDEAQAIWSMAFEHLEPAELDRDHRRMVKEYYGG